VGGLGAWGGEALTLKGKQTANSTSFAREC